MLIFKPKRTVILVVCFSFLIGIGVPFLIYNQLSSGQSFVKLGTKSWIQVFFPAFFLLGALRVLYMLKTIQIDQGIWKVQYMFPRRKRVFSIADIESIQKIDYVTYKYRTPVTTYKIRLKDSKRIQVSSNELVDFEKLERMLNKKEYKMLRKN